MREIINVTIDGATYRELKRVFNSIENNEHIIDFGGYGFNNYQWRLYTKDQALTDMAKECKFMIDKFTEEKRVYIKRLEEDNERLIEELKNKSIS